jgi:Sec-independent protein translocase protein TatA
VTLLSPEKLLVVLVVAVIVLGPDKLPRAARHVSSTWRMLRSLRARLEAEARSAFPDLPAFDSVAEAVRSPLAYLDRLAGEAGEQPHVEPVLPAAGAVEVEAPAGARHTEPAALGDPSCN